jgi:CheY-like chemotaxis protein
MSDQEPDLRKYFSAEHRVPQPDLTPDALSNIDDLGTIGESILRASGFYTRIVSAGRRALARNPAETCILIVEDEEGTGNVIEAVLKKVGYLTCRARNRAEIAAGLAQEPRPDLVLLDVMLPDVDGFEVLNRIRQHPALKHTAVVMLTSRAGPEDIARGLSLGADGYLSKPVLPSTLVDAIRTVTAV